MIISVTPSNIFCSQYLSLNSLKNQSVLVIVSKSLRTLLILSFCLMISIAFSRACLTMLRKMWFMPSLCLCVWGGGSVSTKSWGQTTAHGQSEESLVLGSLPWMSEQDQFLKTNSVTSKQATLKKRSFGWSGNYQHKHVFPWSIGDPWKESIFLHDI